MQLYVNNYNDKNERYPLVLVCALNNNVIN